MSQWLPASQFVIEHPPPVHAPTRQVELAPLHSRLQPPEQLPIVHLALLHGIVQPPVSVQSILQVAPVLQFAWQPPADMLLQSTLQVVLAAHSVVQPPPGQATAQGCAGEPQVKAQVPPLD